MSPLKILIVDDHTLFREGLRIILDQRPDMKVVGEARDGIEAMKMVRALKPDIVLLDITMPKLDGIDTLNKIREISPKTRVIVLTMHAGEQYVQEALFNEACGYVLKDSATEELLSAILAVAKGKAYLSPSISSSVISQYREAQALSPQYMQKGRLSQREKQILRMISKELTTKEISEALNISNRTVENHRGNIMKKLDVHTKVGLVKYAIQTGLVSEHYQ
jgi:DNA-binding NarL/FixJ family response regulator